MKSIKDFENKKVKADEKLKAGKFFRTGNYISGGTSTDRYVERTGLYRTAVGIFDGPRD